ncbi:MAG TPA: pyrroloquinoline quinone biosynthesis peptide chaperone PqqD [Candidatus Dormibacteraeota bacterium]|nr:pyrroloquinoline quinone biosynthesis peptide chaperone PqqD [Candidatus Dormibacteraeota bacterium]
MSSEVLPTSRPRPRRGMRLDWDPVRQRHVLLGPEGVLLLNRTGAAIVDLCDGRQTTAEIVERLRGTYDHVDVDQVRGFLTRLIARGWLEVGDE